MAVEALFMRTDDKKLLSYVESNYDNDQVSVLIYDTQEMEILPLIGTGLYNEISGQITSNSITALNNTLLGHLRNALRMAVLSNGMIVFNYKIRNKGVVTMSSENSQSVDLTVLDRMIQFFKDQAQVYNGRVHNYLRANQASYPLFYNPGSSVDTIRPKSNQYFTGWVMDDNETHCSLDNPSI